MLRCELRFDSDGRTTWTPASMGLFRAALSLGRGKYRTGVEVVGPDRLDPATLDPVTPILLHVEPSALAAALAKLPG